ncbi:MAG: hypothetical protein JJU40_11780 [Rhodobacteraceae bacterium]|nr:hypothetical protein [Paracoccaceae bacterium]
MTDEQYRAFQERARRLARKAPPPPRRRRGSLRLVLRFVMLLVLGAIGFKAGLLIHLGIDAFEARVAQLEQGGPVDRAGSVLMARDPLTDALARVGERFVRH